MARKTKEVIDEIKDEIKKETKKVKKTNTKNSTTEKTTTRVDRNKGKVSDPTKKGGTKKNPSTKSTTKKTAVSSKTVKSKQPLFLQEYYDLPYRYNETVVRILAQTPKMIFVYWDISDFDRENYIKTYGDNFFNDTYPVLQVYNQTKNYHFQVTIDDFTNSWYLPIHHENCHYIVTLCRLPKKKNFSIPNHCLAIASSNTIETPNDHILFEQKQEALYFKNIKTGQIMQKGIYRLPFQQGMNRIYNVYEVYQQIYKDESINEVIDNPSSLSSSFFK